MDGRMEGWTDRITHASLDEKTDKQTSNNRPSSKQSNKQKNTNQTNKPNTLNQNRQTNKHAIQKLYPKRKVISIP